MNRNSKIYVAGHTGLVGSNIISVLRDQGYTNLIFRSLKDLDLTDQRSVNKFFIDEKPEYVFLAAALVGGIVANNTYRADFIYQNIMIQSNVIHACWKYGVKKLLFLGSTCIYPKNAPQPLKEEYLLSSPLEFTNEPYAIAKIAGLKMCEAFNIQYGTNFISVMPTNLYGPGDNFNLEKSHVLPALLRKIHLGKCFEENNWDGIRKDLSRNPVETIDGNSDELEIIKILKKYGIKRSDESSFESLDKVRKRDKKHQKVTVDIWGTGTPYREFMFVADMAEACVFIMKNVNVDDIIKLKMSESRHDNHPQHFLNIGTGEEVSIKVLADRIVKLTGFNGKILFDTSKPDGTMRKATNTTLLKRLGYLHKFNLDKGLAETYSDYLK